MNFFSLWDDYMVWKTKKMAKDIEVHFFPHTGIDEMERSKMEAAELNYEHYHFNDPAEESELPLKWHEAAPCIGKRVLTCHLAAGATDTELKFIWSHLLCCCVHVVGMSSSMHARV